MLNHKERTIPQTLPMLNRRDFCHTVLGGALTAAFLETAENAWAEENERDHWIFISDTHILDNPDRIRDGNNHVKNFVDTREAVFALGHKPQGVIITGDVAESGTLADYRRFAEQIVPYTEKSIPVHCALGNHDSRDNFYAVFPALKKEIPPVADKHVTVLETPNVNLFLLDSLYLPPPYYETGSGFLGYEQLCWLRRELEARKEKPALLFAHHTLDNRQRELMDREELWTIVRSARHVKAYIYGHSHVYRQSVRDDIHLINLPALCWAIGAGQPAGWNEADISKNGIQLTLHTVQSNHVMNGDVRKFEWLR